MSCNHKIPKNHIIGTQGDKNIWKCSSCDNESIWTEDHGSYGNIECFTCGHARMDWVACSDACANKLKVGGVEQ